MRIGIFVLATGRKAGGPEIYEVELVRNLVRIDRENEYFVYCTSKEAVDSIGASAPNFTYRILRGFTRFAGVGIHLPILVKKDTLDFFHCTYAPPPWPNRPFLFTMHCVSNFTHPEFYPRAILLRLNTLQKVGIRGARLILCVSDFVRSYLSNVFKVENERMIRVYNGVGREFTRLDPETTRRVLSQRFGINSPYILFVGKLQARKNVIRLIESYARFRAETKSDAKLVLAGKKVETSEGIDETIQKLRLEREVIELGYIDSPNHDMGLPYLYGGAEMFVFPSLYEGFGIPVIESMACGCPVIASNTTSLPEVTGGAAELVDPLSVDDIAAAMSRVAGSPTLRTSLVERGWARAREFTWERCAQETLNAYARVLR